MEIQMDKTKRIKELVELLNKASKAYYQDAKEIMPNYEYDKLYDELVSLEKETGIVLANSPTVNVGYEVLSELPKEKHASPMLSLDKTKEVDELVAFVEDKEAVLSWKLDGLTIVLTYNNGTLEKAVTRGNGTVGEVVTANAKTFKNIPVSIPYKGKLVLRGEAVITYSDFEEINKTIEDADAKYKNPRNLCSGSVRQLDSSVTAERNVRFIAFALIESDDDLGNSVNGQLNWLDEQGFETVERKMSNASNMQENVDYFAKAIQTYNYPSDGLVLVYDDIAYGLSLGTTAKFPRNGIAFKWQDEIASTKLQYIEWSASRTGLINPVAVFDPVELEGTTVSRASVHNVSIVEELELGVGDEIEVYKANMIIPQIAENKTKSGTIEVPKVCPVCGEPTEIKNELGVKTLHCVNPNCPAKNIKKFTLFVTRNALNIEGLSEETLEKFVDAGFIHEFADIYHLDKYKDEIVTMEGFGEKSYENIIESVENSRKAEPAAVLYGLGIPHIGVSNAKMLCKAFDEDLDKVRNATVEDLVVIDGMAEKRAVPFVEYFQNKENSDAFDRLLDELEIVKPEVASEQNMDGLSFVITGSLNKFENRDELKRYIEDRGGSAKGSVSSATNYLINNDINSNSSKNKRAKELGIEIITEDEVLSRWP
ncbi:MAG: NAD-dependent DNA ligase LigA [Eubacterium sp.]|nr:NAD-dependent DNA ligase LigA [Eubacterium sp.]